ncbi:hypothetical protein AB4Y36_29625 [Paraburkholderia sp. BR10936]|uniref:hypothetical protein n=1 Tax=Paraburkholderia sp. BR10936 TaxID=3236993 RepID=UPI0034D30708
MSVPSSISQLSVTPSLNSPIGSEPVGNNAALYFQAHAAFIAQVANGTQFKTTIPLSMNNLQINNLANGTAATDAATMGQLRSYLPVGAIMLYSGTAASIPTVWGSSWALCNGQNGTPNLMDKFIIGAGNAYLPGATGGATSYTLSVANMPVHSHGVSDPGHGHGVADPGHAHGVYDPGHAHNPAVMLGAAGKAYLGNGTNEFSGGGATSFGNGGTGFPTATSGTGIGIYGAGTGISIYGSGTGISLSNAGSGAAFSVIPPYYALCYVMKIS